VSLSSKQLKSLTQLIPDGEVQSAPHQLVAYSYDNSRLQAMPDTVVIPHNREEIIQLVKWCGVNKIPLISRGHGTGTTGATVPVNGGVVLSMEKMNRILEISPQNRFMVVEPGVTNQQVQDAAAEHGFFWPPDPTSAAVCTIGGNLACNASGPRGVKYGSPRENVLGLEAVNGRGEPFKTGCYTTKGVVGYDLTRLLIGSEGTLAVITQATLKLQPLPQTRQTLRVLYNSIQSAAKAVSRIMAQPVIPYSLEFMDDKAIQMISDYSQLNLPDTARALLLIEVDGTYSTIADSVEAIIDSAQTEGCIDVFRANSTEEIEQLWKTRKSLSPALRKVAPKKINEDIVVPVSEIPLFLQKVAEIEVQHGVTIVNFGHAGNGNLHVNLLVDPDDSTQMKAAHLALAAIFKLTLELRGTLSGEHGIGRVKREYVSQEIDAVAMRMMHDIKHVLDPYHILNPGKSLPDDTTG
jgi:D-lactate dehydrogenase